MDELQSVAKYLLKDVSYAKLQELFTAVRTVKSFEVPLSVVYYIPGLAI